MSEKTAFELLIRVVDKHHPDPEIDAIVTKRGDVIAVKPAWLGWGSQEFDNPEWRIIRIFGISEDEANGMITQESPMLHAPHASRRKRIMRLDVDQLGIEKWSANGINKVSLEAFRKARQTKPLVEP